MRALVCATLVLSLAGTASAAPQDTQPAQAAAEAFVQAIAAKDFEAFKALCAAKLQAEHAKNAKNSKLTRWWEAAQKAQAEHKARWVYKDVKGNLPKNVTLGYTRVSDKGESEVRIGVILEGDRWLVDSAGSL
jgi:hypothetical protein